MQAWDNEAVIYEAQSGHTHLLGSDAARVIAELRQAPADAASLTRILSDMAPGQSTDEAQASLEAILAELAGISLITPVKP
jgi:PqqD family protein of HPr-rel-A system